MLYADIILPLGYEGVLTYSVPEPLRGQVEALRRVVVPLGKTKTVTGLVARTHTEPPAPIKGKDGTERTVELRSIVSVEDEAPVLLPYQYKVWQWIAEYYLCPIGDVLRSALPSGMKQQDGYRPKTETCVRLTSAFRREAALHAALDMLRRATSQQRALTEYLALSHYDTLYDDEPREPIAAVTREELLNVSHATAATVAALVKRGILETYEQPVGRLNTAGLPHPDLIKPLTRPQQKAYDELVSDDPRPTLLHGVTGSGKTELYIRLIQKTIDEGRQVLYLLPEIALTVQMTSRLHRVFGSRLGIYHSRYSDAERVEIWKKQLSAEPYDIILGARSAVFLPMQRLGLIIIDEEHEQSFKQQDPAPRYHARSVALMTANLHPNAVRVVLGTATPAVETFYNATHGKYRLVRLTERYQGMELPHIDIVDTADLQRRKMMCGPFSPQLVEAMRQALAEQRQVILFINRRGFAPIVECHDCGWTPKCEHCDVTLTMHKLTGALTCHYCGYSYPMPKKCPSCFAEDLREHGYGTEKVEERLREMGFEHIARMDLDTTRTKNAYERLITDFAAGRTQILIGTQMVTKGLDFERVSLVGVLNADTLLNAPDFRAYEHAFQMLCQVSGRAGRKGRRGLVIMQSKHPEHDVLARVIRNDYEGFHATQLEERALFRYPPFTRIIYVYLRHAKDVIADSAATDMGIRLRQVFGSRVLGPDKPAVARVKNLYIRKIMLKLELGIDLPRVHQSLRAVRDTVLLDPRYASVQIFYDVDPQ